MNSWTKVTPPSLDTTPGEIAHEHTSGDPQRGPQVVSGLRFVAGTPEMRRIYRQVELLANMDVPVLITGESGTGKHTVARLLHQLSNRAQFAFCELTCAGMPAEILERMLFGIDGDVSMPGKIGLCAEGTLYLDETTELPPSSQARLLQFLTAEDPAGGPAQNSNTPTIRILAGAVDSEITRAIRERRLREDFYYRLNAFSLELPPLRRRREDIPELLASFMERIAAFYRRDPLPFSASTIETCMQCSWPGNLRELENFVRRYLFIGSESNALDALRRGAAEFNPPAQPSQLPLAVPRQDSATSGAGLKVLIRNLKGEAELSAIRNALQQTNWNRRQAAHLLNISYRGMLYKIREYGLQPSVSQIDRKVDVRTNEGMHDPAKGTHS